MATVSKFVSVGLRVSGAVRTETFLGRKFRVAPAVLVRSQVLRNNLGVTFLPSADITDEWANLWNGIPVLVGPHPSLRGVAVSGRDAQLWNERLGGWIFRAKAVQENDDVRHLAGEVWLDESRAANVEGLQAVLDRLGSGEPVELSTGFAAQLVPEHGTFQGTAYEAVLHPAGADHLVISTDMTGACSVQDGCGLGVNKYEGTPPMEQQVEKKGWKSVLARAAEIFQPAPREPVTWEDNIAHQVARELEIRNATTPSDQDRASLIRSALQEKFGSRGEVIVADVYSETREVVFWLITPLGSEPPGPEYFRVSFTDGEGGALNFGEPVKVRRMTVYEPVGNTSTSAAGETQQTAVNCNCASTEEATMSDKNKEGQDNAALEALTKTVGELATAVQSLAGDVKAMKEAAASDPNPSIAGLKQTVAELHASVESMKGVTQTAVQERERERQDLIGKLAGNFRCPFTAEDLAAKPIEELRKLATMAQVENYSGRGGPRGTSTGSETQRFAEPVPYWTKESAKNQNRKEA